MVERIPAGLAGLVVAAAVIAQPAQLLAQGTEPAGLRGDLRADVVQLERKYVELAEAMPASSWDWTPMEGVRSVGEVFCHVAGANYMIPRFFGVDAPAVTPAMRKCRRNTGSRSALVSTCTVGTPELRAISARRTVLALCFPPTTIMTSTCPARVTTSCWRLDVEPQMVSVTSTRGTRCLTASATLLNLSDD